MRFSRSILALLPLVAALPLSTPSVGDVVKKIKQRTSATGTTAADYLAYATSAINELQSAYYDASSGLWGAYDGTTGEFTEDWWNSANILTMLADLQEKFPTAIPSITSSIFTEVYNNAPNTYAGFLDGYYDDELWWALAWIKVYDVTSDDKYLTLAKTIWEDANSVFGEATCGGLWWDKAHTGVNAIENSLYITAAAKLANRSPSLPSAGYYFAAAMEAWAWFEASGMINSDNLINDGLDLSTCKNNGGIVFSYNQGAILQGLAELTWATGDASYNTLANTIATAAITHLTDSAGIFHDSCETTGCDGDEQQFKGVFARAVEFLTLRGTGNSAAQTAAYLEFLQVNADAVWADDRNAQDQLGLVWSGGSTVLSLQTQGSALDVLVGAAAATLG